MEYKLWETSPIGSKTKYPPELVKLSFIISSGEYEKKEHYFIYDGNTLIADIGGYLSLLLGFSILSIFKSFVDIAAAWRGAKRLFTRRSAIKEGKAEAPTDNISQSQKGHWLQGMVEPI